MDKFRVKVLAGTPHPQQIVYHALHQDHSENFVYDELASRTKPYDYLGDAISDVSGEIRSDNVTQIPKTEREIEQRYGQIVVSKLLKGNKGHYGCLEHITIVLACGSFPHSMVMQLRTHRLTSFDVQSGRYTGKRFCKVASGALDVDEVFYLRPVGTYHNPDGKDSKRFDYTVDDRERDRDLIRQTCQRYAQLIDQGCAYEQARSIIAADYRQHFILSLNCRSLMHILDIRLKPNAQLEIQSFCNLLLQCFQDWTPEIADWYVSQRKHKGMLAP